MAKRPGMAKLGSDKQSRKAQANDDERKLAKRLGGIRQPASGALPAHKGDVKLDHFLLDHKATDANSMVVSVRDLVKISKEASGEHKKPGLVIEFQNDAVSMAVERAWVLLPVSVLEQMLAAGQDKSL